MIPGLSKWQIDQARSHAAEEGPGQPVVSEPIKRTRLDPVKTNHFVNFIASANFIEDVAYGTKELKLDSGEKIPIPDVIRTMVPSRIIKQYISHCQETEFKPASERTLYTIIDVCAACASRQKSLQGLDYFLTEGAQAFELVERVIMVLEEGGATSIWGKEAKAHLERSQALSQNRLQEPYWTPSKDVLTTALVSVSATLTTTPSLNIVITLMICLAPHAAS